MYNCEALQNTGYFNNAHHIIALKEESASISRGIIVAVGIDINSATNGILLPHVDSNTPYPLWAITESGHTNYHDRDYFTIVQNELIEALRIYDKDLPAIIRNNSSTEQEVTEALKKYINNDEKIKEELNKIICDCIFEIKIDLLNGELNL